MTFLILVLCLADVALGVLLVAVSGMMFQGVNNTGPMSGAWLFGAALVLCLVAPLVAWTQLARRGPGVAAVIAAIPLVMAALVVLSDG